MIIQLTEYSSVTAGSNTGSTYWKIKMPYLQSKIQCAAENVQELTPITINSKQLPVLQALPHSDQDETGILQEKDKAPSCS